jgi:murein DD-endopeptidase MepM/ murein hydrolase activator NlpD
MICNRMKRRLLFVISQVFFLMAISSFSVLAQSNQTQDYCSTPVLGRLKSHQIAPGETLETIAQTYNLLPESIISVNPSLQAGQLTIGQEILIPPFNGIRVEVPPGGTWKDLEAAYGIRADVLFEVNGCQTTPTVVFIPGVSWSGEQFNSQNQYTGLSGYPLPTVAKVGLSFGWQINSQTQENTFHSGIDLLAEVGTQVLAVEGGVVVFAGVEGNYGNLIIINHPQGQQTRYAQLQNIQVEVGQEVNTGDIIGTVGVTGLPDIPQPHLHFEVRYNTPVGWVAQEPKIHLQFKR